ncbi:MAG: cupredoxin domain-containing protein [Acidimicrobiales bacterium]
MNRFVPALVVAGFVAVTLLTGGLVARASGGAGGDAGVLGPGRATVTLDIVNSRFAPERVTLRPGTEVRFVVVNGDPINHELIVGGDEVHERHESGNHAQHPPVPGEVSVGAKQTAETTFRFDEPGDVVFACHLPGHYAYGMRGVVRVSEDHLAVGR